MQQSDALQEYMAENIEMQTRISELQNANERLREERDNARSSVDLLMHENHALTETNKVQAGWLDRLRLHVEQMGI